MQPDESKQWKNNTEKIKLESLKLAHVTKMGPILKPNAKLIPLVGFFWGDYDENHEAFVDIVCVIPWYRVYSSRRLADNNPSQSVTL